MADKLNQQQQIDDIVSMLDGFMEQGGGRMNIDARTLTPETEQNIQNEQFFGCGAGQGRKWACQTPTLMDGLDFEENNKQ